MGTSTFSQYTVVVDDSVVAINPSAPLEKVCLIGCGITTAWGAVTKQQGVKDSTVAVFGCGGIGLGVISTSALVGASRIIAIDINPKKEAWARKFGATDFVNPTQLPEGKRIQDYLVEITDGGLDFTFDATGNVGVVCTPFTNLALIQVESGRYYACRSRSVSQGMGCFDHHWYRCCRTGDFHSPVSRTSRRPQSAYNRIQLILAGIDSSWSPEGHGAEPPLAVSKDEPRSQVSSKVSVHGTSLEPSQTVGLDYLSGKVKVDEYVSHRRTLSTISSGFDDLHVGIDSHLITICYRSIGYIGRGLRSLCC